ncbi:hypothetical protein OF83DRAFT_1090509 [Amylostereum chailletii]|nr:hypothetical protein OF83DRAFT_1090509 [Amylostereum chailletii]
MPKGKKSLSAALSSQQSRLKKNSQAKEAALAAEQKEKGKKSAVKPTKGKGKAPLHTTNPFHPTDKILLVGEGNFSFSRALALLPPSDLEHLPSTNIFATAYDSEDECYAKYPDAIECVSALRAKGVHVLFGVDATRLDKCVALKGKRFDRIVWNFPHAGKGIADQDRNILSNQVLILGFLRSAENFLVQGPVPQVIPRRKRKHNPDDDEDEATRQTDDENETDEAIGARGTVLITLRNVAPYTEWDVPRLAKLPPPPQSVGEKPNPHYTLLRSFAFHRSAWKDYEHRMTKGERAHGTGKTGEGGEDRTWEFCLKDSDLRPPQRVQDHGWPDRGLQDRGWQDR